MTAVPGPVLSIDGLSVQFRGDGGWVSVVEDVSLRLGPGECVGLAGESGSGKSVTALSVLGLHAKATTRIPSGTVTYGGRNLLALPERELRRIRGGEIAMIFQDPMSSLNPVLTVGDQIAEVLKLHHGMSAAASRAEAVALLRRVRIPDAERRIGDYPHRLSGGMRQRVMIAMAIACRPKVLIADEPTTALDVTIQAGILELLQELRDELGMSVLLITHDLGTLSSFAERVVVMYAGRVVEDAPTKQLFAGPLHPYTEGLIAAIPPLDRDVGRLNTMAGSIPDPATRISGCRFHPRCPQALQECRELPPPLLLATAGHLARCPPRVRQDASCPSRVLQGVP